MTQAFDITGKRALITGASSGLGVHIAHVLSGSHLTLYARRMDKLEETAAAIRAAGGTCDIVVMDVANPASVAAVEPRALFQRSTSSLTTPAWPPREARWMSE